MKRFPSTHFFALILGVYRAHTLFGGLITFLCLGLLATTGGAQTFVANHERARQAPEQSAKVSSAVERRVPESFGTIPLSFEPNVGQTDSEVRFLSRGDGYTIFLTDREAVLSLKKPAAKALSARAPGRPYSGRPPVENSNPAILRMRLLGASPHAQAEAIGRLPGKTNYFLGNDRTGWRTGVPNYAKVRLSDVYPGIDLVYYGNQRQMEYDFVVAPAANPDAIRLQFEGSDRVKVDSDGDLVVTISGGDDLRFRKPATYQLADASAAAPDQRERRAVRGAWRVEGKDSARFEIGSYDPHRPLVIDPVLVYSTYLGGSSPSGGGAIAVDSAGSVYIAGSTNSTNFPVSNSAFQKTYGGNSTVCANNNDCGDVFVTKLDPSGTSIVYSTFLGGSNDEYGVGIALDAAGNAYITGGTSSLNFPTTTGAFQTTCQGCYPLQVRQNAFVTELNPSGSALVYSTFLGGSANNRGSSIAVDSMGNAYIAGWTASADFPVTSGAFQTTITADQSDAFVSKLNPAGSALVYSTYLGGGAVTWAGATAIAVDSAGSAYVTGTTNDSNFPTTPGAFQTPFGLGTTPGSNPLSSYVTKLNSAGSGLVYSSLYSGWSSRIVVDSLGSAYVAGTSGPLFPTTPGALNGNCAWGGFLSKFTPDGSNLIYSDYFCNQSEVPGRPAFLINTLALDPSGNAYIGGGTDSTSFPTTAGALQTQIGNACCFSDGVLMKVTPGGSVAYSTYLGGNSSDTIFAVAADDSGNAYLTGFTQSTNFPTQNPIKGSLSAAFDAFITKLSTNTTSLSAWPPVVTFGDQGLMTNSFPLPVYVANASNASIGLSGIAVAGNFTQTNNCPASLEPGVRCAINVVFNPQAAGAIAGTLTITPGGAEGPLSIPLGGNGVDGPVAVLTPAAPNWPGQPVGFASPPRTITLTNVGNKQLNVDGLSIVGPFGLAGNDCAAVLPQASCSVGVIFNPPGGGNSFPGEITFLDNVAAGPASLQLTGSVVNPGVVFSDPGLKFPDEPVGTASATQSVFLVNGLATAITLNSISASADFMQSNTCGATLASHAYCSLTVAFNPTSNGLRRGTVTVNDTGAGSPHVLYLFGAGVGPEVGLSVSELNFGTELMGATSAAQSVTLTNTGATVLTITSIATTAGFNQTNACGASLSAGASCAINVSFSPTSMGAQVGNLTITTNSAPTTATMVLSGSGIAAVAGLSTTSLTFSGQPVNTPSPSQPVTLTNTGNIALTISSVAVGGDFSQTNTCGASVAAGGNCTISVTFTPTANGARSGSLTVTDNASGSPQTVTLSGTGTGPLVSLSSPLTFSAQLAGSTSASQTVTLTNTGSANLTLTAIGITSPFAIASSGTTCSTSTPVAASATCTVAVTFKPTAAGAASGGLSFTDNAPSSPQTITLSGTGQDFTFAPPSGSSTTSTVVRGQPATYILSVGGQGGISGTVTFTCTGAPSEATCRVSPNPATAGSSATNVTVTVTTTAATLSAPRSRPLPPVPPLSTGLRGLWMLALVLAAMLWAVVRRNQPGASRWQSAMLLLASAMLLALALGACGGGAGGGGTTHDPGTPVGTYSLTVTGTTGSGSSTLSHSVTLTLTVN